jgi:hypothetical protein
MRGKEGDIRIVGIDGGEREALNNGIKKNEG